MTSEPSDATSSASYDVIRGRLVVAARRLHDAAKALDAARREAFGGTDMTVMGNTRVRTENNCVPMDIVNIGGRLIFAYNVRMGLKREVGVGDVFDLHRRVDGTPLELQHLSLAEHGDFLNDPQFIKHLTALYQYYDQCKLLTLRHTQGKLLAVFQVGRTHADIKVLRWAVDTNAQLTYLDNRGEPDHQFPPSHDFEWLKPSSDAHTLGEHPHISILDEVFVETVGGDLTIKVEDNTADGEGIYSEAVDDPNQSLDDADIYYAQRGNLILLKMRPYGEDVFRYLVFNKQTRTVARIDAIGQSCRTLPEDHGILFPGGYSLRTGEHKVFAPDTQDMRFERTIASPNGEDVLYVFQRQHDGLYALYPYNLIQKEVINPLTAHGYTLFEDGTLVVFRADENPTRVHPMQVWSTAFVSDEFHAAQPEGEGLLARIGNKDLVRGISDAFTLCSLAQRSDPTRQIYEELVLATNRFGDAYYWIDEAQVGDLRSLVADLRATAELIIDEFEKVLVLQRRAKTVLVDARAKQTALLADVQPEYWRDIQPFLKAMTGLRQQRGRLITLKEVRYVDLDTLGTLEQQVIDAFDEVSQGCVRFLLGDDALAPVAASLTELDQAIAKVARTSELTDLQQQLDTLSGGVDLLSEVVAGLQVDDPTQKTQILGHISEVFGQVNRVRALLRSKHTDLAGAEGKAEFAARFQLLSLSVANALGQAETPDACDDQLANLLLQLEELEASFGEFDEFMPQLATKREEVYDAFSAKKQALVDARNRRIAAIVGSADRILAGVLRRSRTFKDNDELNAYFASDAMVLKLHQLSEQLAELGDTVKQDELQARLKTAKQDALRGLRDKLELFADGDDLIRFGKHQFTVNTQPLDLTVVPRGDGLALHLTGTDLYLDITDAEFQSTRPFWTQSLVSETAQVGRAEYLAWSVLQAAERGDNGWSLAGLLQLATRHEDLLKPVRTWASERYQDGYDRGIHDHDATRILSTVLHLRQGAGVLRFAATPRALACLFWASFADKPVSAWCSRARSLARLRAALGPTDAVAAFSEELCTAIASYAAELDPDLVQHAPTAGTYLFEELAREPLRFTFSADAHTLRDGLYSALQTHGGRSTFDDELRAHDDRPAERFSLVRAWVEAFAKHNQQPNVRSAAHATLEATALLFTEHALDQQASSARTHATVTGLLAQHRLIEGGSLNIRLDEFTQRLDHFVQHRVPGFVRYRKARTQMLERERHRLRVDEYRPQVMSSFVRNKLINDVYLPMIGDNLAKQLGAAGDAKRTDLMGLLLLISPPGYGKTTLMEYVANRLGLVFMKINGPSLGHSVVSLDPDEAPNATARQEVDKVNLALEMGNNVMLYLDDIQHTHPEFLQKFISLCDAQRRIEGVWQGRTRTYDLRGKKFCVVMAGNPYTESGDKFQIPDMLANRADTYNLGDILSGRDEAFALSFIENALTSNPTLAPLAARSQADVYKLIDMANGVEVPTSDLEHDYSALELTEITDLLKRMAQCQRTLLMVNAEYIRSASMEDAFRTEPRFQLQGSYRNMNKLAEKLVGAMTAEEVEDLVTDHYQGESQTLTTGAESNLLKLAELRGTMTAEQSERWGSIKDDFKRIQLMGSGEDDPVTRVTGVLGGVVQQLTTIGRSLQVGQEAWPNQLRGLEEQLAGVQYGLGDLGNAVKTAGGDTDVAEALQGVRQALEQRETLDLGPHIGRPLVHIARSLAQQSEKAADQGMAGKLDALLTELKALRQAAEAGALSPATVQAPPTAGTDFATALKHVQDDARVDDARKAMLRRATVALHGGTDSSEGKALASALHVIEQLTVEIAAISKQHLPPDNYERFMDELRRAIAGSVIGVAAAVRE